MIFSLIYQFTHIHGRFARCGFENICGQKDTQDTSFRCLLQCGDIETNPGPSVKTDITAAVIVELNHIECKVSWSLAYYRQKVYNKINLEPRLVDYTLTMSRTTKMFSLEAERICLIFFC